MKAMTAIAARKEKGFTLIELVMVSVILGLLAAFALPRFADFGNEARVASLDGAIGAVKSASSIAHSRWLANGDGAATVVLDGVTVAIDTSTSGNGFPTAATGGIGAAAQLDANDYTIGAANSGVATITPTDSVGIDRDGDGTAGECSFDYDQADGTIDNRVIEDC